MNILLADDERLTRLGIKSMIEELYPLQHHFHEVANGEQLLEFLKKNRPDLIFLDIHMPKLSGLQAFAQFTNLNIPVIILTGYAEFSYAKEALKLGALDYLLKPASLEEVGVSMEKVLGYIREQKTLLKKDYELEFEKILDLYNTIGFLQPPKHVLPPYTSILFYFDQYEKESFHQHLKYLEKILDERSHSYDVLYTFTFLPSGELCYLISGDISSASLNKDLQYFFQDIQSSVTGFYLQASDLKELFLKMEKIRDEESLRLCTSPTVLITDDICEPFRPFLPFFKLIDQFLMAHRSGDTLECKKIIMQLEQIPQKEHIIRTCHDALVRILTVEPHHTVSLTNFTELTSHLKSCCTETATSDPIQQIQRYVEENYMKQIGINTIADRLNISPNYLSRIYKLKTGENFMDYLTRVRMEQAIELMKKGQVTSVRETAEKVGYFSSRYFTRVFLKYTGSLPSEYMKQFLLS